MSDSKKHTVVNVSDNNICKSHGGGSNNRALTQQHVIGKLQRHELEDRYYNACEENIRLKKLINSQNIKKRLLSTKLLRLNNQNKKDEAGSSRVSFPGEEIIEDQANRIDELEQENKFLIEKLHNHNIHNADVMHGYDQCKYLKGSTWKDNDGNIHKGILKSDNSTYSHDDDQMILDLHMGNTVFCDNENCPKKLELKKEIADVTIKHKQKILALERKVKEYKNLADSLRQKYEESCSKTSKSKNTGIQTDSEINSMRDSDIIESLTQQLAEEKMLVLDMKNELKTTKLAQNIFDEVDGRLSKLNSTVSKRENEKSPKKHIKDKESTLTSQKIAHELETEKINSQVLKTLNTQLNSQILEMQKELDKLRLKIASKQHKEVRCVEFIDIAVGTDNIPESPKLTPERKVSNAGSDIKLSLNESQLINITMETVKNHNKLKSSKEKSQLESLLLDKEDCKVIKLHGDSGVTDERCDKSPKNVQSGLLEQKRKQLSPDNATYDISNNESQSSSEISDFHLESYNEYLSDGEIPKGDPKSRNKNQFEKEKSNEFSTTTETKVETALQILSKEIEMCKKLIGTTTTPRHSDKNEQSLSQKVSSKKIAEKTSAKVIVSKQSLKPSKGSFTLHITSVEFTDDVMSYLNGLPYFLTWKFYDQLIAHTPMRTEQLSLYDFSSSYDINLNREFAKYFITDQITVEAYKAIDDSSKMFASCNIELKQILYKPHEKVSMVLLLKSNDPPIDCGILNCECILAYDASFSTIIQEVKLKESEICVGSLNSASGMNIPEEQKVLLLKKDSDQPENDDVNDEREDEKNPNEIEEPSPDINIIATEKELPVSKFIVLTVLWLTLNDGSPILVDENITQLFVEYSFLGYQGQETESTSVPKPQNGEEKITIDFRKVFKVDKEQFFKNRMALTAMLSNETAPEDQIIIFTVVSEPEEDPLGLDNCEDLGKASLNIFDLVSQSNNVVSCEVYPDIYLIANPSQIMGTLAVKVEGLDLMRICQNECVTPE